VKLASSFGVLLVKLAIAVCSEELLLQLCFGFDFVLHFAARQKDIVSSYMWPLSLIGGKFPPPAVATALPVVNAASS
jgi:hypothetical protein